MERRYYLGPYLMVNKAVKFDFDAHDFYVCDIRGPLGEADIFYYLVPSYDVEETDRIMDIEIENEVQQITSILIEDEKKKFLREIEPVIGYLKEIEAKYFVSWGYIPGNFDDLDWRMGG